MTDGPDLMSFIVLWALGALVGLAVLFWVIRGAVVSGMKRAMIWERSGGLADALEQYKRDRERGGDAGSPA